VGGTPRGRGIQHPMGTSRRGAHTLSTGGT
jgi:hypothetical protein